MHHFVLLDSHFCFALFSKTTCFNFYLVFETTCFNFFFLLFFVEIGIYRFSALGDGGAVSHDIELIPASDLFDENRKIWRRPNHGNLGTKRIMPFKNGRVTF
jgi:hypothetical protein